jgi:hypothetical protein
MIARTWFYYQASRSKVCMSFSTERVFRLATPPVAFVVGDVRHALEVSDLYRLVVVAQQCLAQRQVVAALDHRVRFHVTGMGIEAQNVHVDDQTL